MNVKRAWMFASLLSVGCVGSVQRSPQPVQVVSRVPEHMGLPIYTMGVEQSSLVIQHAWQAWEKLHSHAQPTSIAPSQDTREWVLNVWTPWLDEHKSMMRGLFEQIRPLVDQGPDEVMFSALLMVKAFDDLEEKMRTLPTPREIAASPESERAFRDTLAGVLMRLTEGLRPSWEKCLETVDSASERLRTWRPVCEKKLADLEAMAHRGSVGPHGIAFPQACEGESFAYEPSSLPPDLSVPMSIALVFDINSFAQQTLDDATKDRLLRAVEARLRRMPALRGVTILSRQQVRDAEALVTAKKVHPAGPVCGQAPTLGMVLSQTYKHLVYANAQTQCDLGADGQRTSCSLMVEFERPASDNQENLPQGLISTAPATTPMNWLALVGRLAVHSGEGIGYGGLGTTGSGAGTEPEPLFVLTATDDDDVYLRLHQTLRSQSMEQQLKACRADNDLAAFDAKWTIGADGSTSVVQVAPKNPSIPSANDSAACLQRVLSSVAWPCTRTGAPVNVQVTLCSGRY